MDNQVTVIIPCGGNHSEYVRDAVCSCLKATPAPDEIVVVDDFTEDYDKSARIHLVAKHYRLKQHRGRSHARNFGVNKASTPWVFFLDADDFLEPTAIADFRTIVNNAQEKVDLVYADYDYLDDQNKRVRVRKKPFSRSSIRDPRTGRYSTCNYANIGLFVRRERFLAIGGFDEDMCMGEYWDLFLRYIMNPNISVVKHDRPFFVARQGSSVLPNAQELMAKASLKIRAMLRGGYYKEWERR